MKHIIALLVAAMLPLVAFAQNLVTAEALKLIEGSQADVLYANEFGNFRNDELDVPFPYCVIRIDLEGDVEKAKTMLSLNVGSMFRVEAKDVFKDNMILFLVSSSVRQVYLQCGDGCKPQQLHYGTLQANKVYACKVTFKAPEEKKAVDNSDAMMAQMAAMQKRMEEMEKQNQQMQQALQNQQQGDYNKGANGNLKPVVNKMEIDIGGLTFNMIKVDGGKFQMGNHNVTLSDYFIGEMEVTQELWVAVMGDNPSYHKGDSLPVEKVSWNDCQEFIHELNKMTGQKFSLPTEAQWIFAAHGGNLSRRYKYSGSDDLGSVAWYDDNSSNETHPVGMKQANELGIYDMSGNVWEWCLDWYGAYTPYPQFDPTGPLSGSGRVNRGGSWYNYARSCHLTYRNFNSPNYRYSNLGLRLALQVTTK